ncbi:hypothetical protein [Streptomyces sp. NPDC054940]
MSAQTPDIALRRRCYTGESVQQARRATNSLPPGTSPIPAAADLSQQILEARVLLGLLECRNVYTRYPLGIIAVHPHLGGIALRVESVERAAEILFNLLPTYVDGDLRNRLWPQFREPTKDACGQAVRGVQSAPGWPVAAN